MDDCVHDTYNDGQGLAPADDYSTSGHITVRGAYYEDLVCLTVSADIRRDSIRAGDC